MKPLIGITPLFDYQKDSLWLVPAYAEGIAAAGGIPIILPLKANNNDLRRLVGICGGFLFTGGQDISPTLYGAESSPFLGETCPEKDSLEARLFKLCLKYDKPVFGICRGIQLINALLGGTLYQDLPSEHPSKTIHAMKPPYNIPCHKVSLIEGTPLQKYLGETEIAVNSYHHQAIKDLSPKLKPAAYSEDGLVEAVYMPDKKFICAVQWHPEFMSETDPLRIKVFKYFIEHTH